MIDRIMGVLRLDVDTFESIEHDEAATGQAAIIVTIIALVNAVGAYFFAGSAAGFLEGLEGVEGVDIGSITSSVSPIGSAIQALVSAYVTWGLWAVLTYFIGTNLFQAKATINEMLRVIGFGMAPQILGFIPCIGFLASIYSLVTVFIGIRQGLDIDNTKTAITVVLSWLVAIVVSLCVLGPIFGAIFALTG